jgi:hypothetical protein
MSASPSILRIVTLLVAVLTGLVALPSSRALGVEPADATATVTTPSPTLVPRADDAVALGAYIPGAPSNPSKIDAYAAMTGAMPAVVMWYQSWAGPWNSFYARGADAIHARGSMPMISWEPWAGLKDDPQWSLASINAGNHDAYIRSWARDVAAWGKPIYVRPMYEMNGTWTSWSPGVNGNTAAEFRQAWRHIVDLVRAQGASNISWVWAPNVDDGNPRYTPYADVYPGDRYVDWAGLDGYNWGTSQSWSRWQGVRSVFASSIEQISGVTSKPLMIAEIGSTELGGDKAAWITNGYARLQTDFPEVRAVIWFHGHKETDWRVDSSIASLEAYRAVVAGMDFPGTALP